MKTLIIRGIVCTAVLSPFFLAFWALYRSDQGGLEPVANLAATLIVIAVIGGLIRLFLHRRETYWRRNEPNVWRRNVVEYQKELPGRIESSSVPCVECENTAKPILNSDNRYRCSSCGEEFAGPDHWLVDVEQFIELHPPPKNRPYPLKP